VIGTPGSDDWTIDASHETIEMLVDPAGNRLQTSRAITIDGNGVRDGAGEFQYLVEACDPCEANDCAYSIQGIAVSDFITPHFYDPVTTPGTRYSFAGHLTAPRQVLPGGYISFINSESDEWQQILFLGATPQLRDLGPAQGASLRVWVDGQTEGMTRKVKRPNTALLEECRRRRASMDRGARLRAARYAPAPAAAGVAPDDGQSPELPAARRTGNTSTTARRRGRT
jgi:hypothetical protein